MGTSNARSSARFFCAFFRHAGLGHRYAPRPAALPRASSEMAPSGARTTRMSSGLGFFTRQPTHCRWGMDLGMGDCLLSVYASLSGLMSIL